MARSKENAGRGRRLEMSPTNVVKIVESFSDGFLILDEKLRVTYFSRSAEELLNRKRDEVLGRELFDAFPEAKGSIFEENYRKALKEKRSVVFETYFPIEPYVNWYEVRAHPYEGGIAVYFQVITERKRAEHAAERERQNLVNLLEAIEDGVYVVDQEYNIQYINSSFRRDYGPYSGRKCYDYFHDRTSPCPWCSNEQIFAGETVRFGWLSKKTGKFMT